MDQHHLEQPMQWKWNRSDTYSRQNNINTLWQNKN